MTRPPVACKHCNAPIFYAVERTTGRRIAVNEQPLPVGDIRLDWNGSIAAAEHVGVGGGADHEALYLDHSNVCPNAHEDRRNPA